MPTEDRQAEPLFTLDTRPVAQAASNRADEVAADLRRPLAPLGRGATAGISRHPLGAQSPARPKRADLERDQDLLVQIGSIFAYAMVGAVLFHVAWWALV